MDKNEERMAAEVLQLIELLNPEDSKKIPVELKEYLNKKCNYRIATIIDPTKKLKNQDVCKETLDMIAVIYEKYLATPEELAELKNRQDLSHNSTELFKRLAQESC